MEITFSVGSVWKLCGRPYEPVTSHKILKNVLIESENSKDRLDLMVNLLAQMEERLPPFNAIYINLNPDVECHEIFTEKFTYGSSEFNVPYYLELGDRLYDVFNRCFNAVLNFHPELRVIMGIIYQNCMEKGFPTSIIGFLELMRTFLQEHRYGEEFANSLLNNIKDAQDLFENDNALEQTLRIGSKIPEWIALWRIKQKIWIDLSRCKPHIQKMLIPIIFLNLLRATDHYGSAKNYWHLNGAVLINDADKAFASVPWERYKAHYNLRKSHWERLEKQNIFIERNLFFTKEQIVEAYGDPFFLFRSKLEPYYSDLLHDEFRFRNITLFTGTGDENNIHDFISSLSQAKFVLNE